ncbi:MAG TPA: hypothetical protein VFU12_03950 [Glycomyces sp.]|nr:hypothetical protein [Glycomyces sp.]
MRERRGIRPAWTTRLVAGAAGAALAVAASPVYAQEDDESSGAEKICDLHDRRLEGAAGIVAAQEGDGWWIVSEGFAQDETLSIMRVGDDCSVRESDESWIAHQPRDPQALAFDTDGFLWVGDTGEALDRPSIAINQIKPGDEANAAIYRFVFPGGPEEVEAFVVEPDVDYPLFFSAAEGETTIYRPTEEKRTEDTPMASVGSVALSEGGSVTGAALNDDATKVVLRTANAAYEWTVEGGDVLGALTGGEPVVTPLDDEGAAQGIAYDAEGAFITLSQVESDDSYGSLYRHAPAAPAAEEPAGDEGEDQAAGAAEDDGGIVDFLLDLGFDTIVRILAGIAVVGFLVMLGGILVIRKSRRERAAAEDDDDDAEPGFAAEEPLFADDKDDPVDIGLETGQPDPEVGRIAQGGAVYGAPKAEPTGNVYGAKRAEQSGNVYGGGAEAAGSVYGAAAPEPEPEPAGRARSEPHYGAFEGAGQGSVYDDAGGSFAAEPPPPPSGGAYGTPRQAGGAVYGAGETTGSTYGSPRPSGGVYGGQSAGAESTGTVYGAGGRGAEQDEGHWAPPDEGGHGRRR